MRSLTSAARLAQRAPRMLLFQPLPRTGIAVWSATLPDILLKGYKPKHGSSRLCVKHVIDWAASVFVFYNLPFLIPVFVSSSLSSQVPGIRSRALVFLQVSY